MISVKSQAKAEPVECKQIVEYVPKYYKQYKLDELLGWYGISQSINTFQLYRKQISLEQYQKNEERLLQNLLKQINQL